jgi:hypothetical protein
MEGFFFCNYRGGGDGGGRKLASIKEARKKRKNVGSSRTAKAVWRGWREECCEAEVL